MVEYIYDFKEPPDPEGYRGRLVRCKDCKHKDKKETDEPCNECLGNCARPDTHKPLRFEEKVGKGEK